MLGVLDRFEGNLAVILVEENNEQFTIEREKLPAESVEGTWFHLSKHRDSYHVNSIDIAKTEEKSAANALLLERLQKRRRKSKFE